MRKAFWIVLVLITGTLALPRAFGQSANFCMTNAATLYCRIPATLFGTTSSGGVTAVVNPLQPLDESLATQLTLVPLASPASGIVYTEDPATKIPVATGTETFGPVLTERGETLYTNRVFAAVTFQRFRFDTLDGVNLQRIPMLFEFCIPAGASQSAGQCGPIAANIRTDVHLDQFAFFGTYGVTNWLDVSAAVPFETIAFSANGLSCSQPYCSFSTPGGTTVSFTNAQVGGSASHLGDVVFRGKAQVLKYRLLKLALGSDLRIPTGDALNFLGSGCYGVKPFLALSRSGLISVHLNTAYQWNGASLLAGAVVGETGKLPETLSFAVGSDMRVIKSLTVAVDYLGEHVVNASRLQQTTTMLGVANTTQAMGSFDTQRAAFGFKWNPVQDLLVSGNVLAKFDHNGLHHTPVPLVGISYTF